MCHSYGAWMSPPYGRPDGSATPLPIRFEVRVPG
jgi:hypothetical protein